nr:hypothetical protein [Tissierella sp.]
MQDKGIQYKKIEVKNQAEKIYLKKEKDFVNIEGNYGAYQNWLFTGNHRKKFWADRSCGLAAAGNVAYYLTQNHKKPLYNYPEMTVENFTLFLNELYKFIRPRLYGIPTLAYMKRGFTRFAKSNGVSLQGETINMRYSREYIIGKIKEVLAEDVPIMMLTWNTHQPHLKYHWVTITGYFRDEKGGNFIVTSNWGRREIFNLDRWLAERSFYKGLIYFK